MGLTVVLSILVLCQTSVLWNAHGVRPPITSLITEYCKESQGGKCTWWTDQRKALHEKIVAQAQLDMMALGQAFDDANMGAMLFALRGNTACGKSTAIKKSIPELNAAPEVLKVLETNQFPTLNLDDYKTELEKLASLDFKEQEHHHDKIPVLGAKGIAKAEDVFTDTDVHLESKTVKDLVMAWAKGAELNEKPLSFILDGRLAGKTDHTEMYNLASSTKRKLTVIDIDCPLDVSLERLLGRSHRKFDPIPGFQQVATEGFVQSRANRFNFVTLYSDTQDRTHLGRYVLVTTTPQLTQKIALTIEGGKKTVELLDSAKAAGADVETRAEAAESAKAVGTGLVQK